MTKALKVFISYAHEDESFKNELLKHTSSLKRSGIIEIWEDRQIKPGDKWRELIASELEDCDMGLLLISSDFMDSEFISKEELNQLLERQQKEGIQVIPIIVRSCLWDIEAYAELQVLPKDGKAVNSFSKDNDDRDQVWTAIVKQLAEWAKTYQLNPIISHRKEEKESSPQVDIHRLPKPSARLVGRQAYLDQLNAALNNQAVSLISLIAGGGVGKSAISDEWMERLRLKNYSGATRIFAWSFYSQGSHETATSSTPFFSAALPFFGHKSAMPDNDEQKARCLAELLTHESTILILDGVEPLQYSPQIQRGWFSDIGLKLLLEEVRLKGLAPNSLVLVSSRQSLVELEHYQGRGYEEINLDFLSPQEGMELLKSLGVKTGLESEYLETVKDMGGHALAVVLLGKLLAQAHNGDIARRDLIPDLFAAAADGGHAWRVMEYYDQHYWEKDAHEGVFLRLLGLFDRPIDQLTVEVLLQKADFAQSLPGYNSIDWNQMISQLRTIGLLLEEESLLHQVVWDCHPLVRQYFGQCLHKENLTTWKQAHGVLFDYFQAVPEEKHPEGLQELAPLYRAVYHGCLAGKYAKALDEVYWERIDRGAEGYGTNKLGAYAEALSALSGFFPHGWGQVVTEGLTEDDQAWLLAEAAFCLVSLGRLQEAIAPRGAVIVLREKLQDWENSALTAENLVALLLPLGQLKKAEKAAQQGISWAEKSEDLFRQMISQSKLAMSLYYQGLLGQSLTIFQKAEVLQIEDDAEHPLLRSLRGAHYCVLLLMQAEDQQQNQLIYQRTQTYSQWRERQPSLLEIAQNQLTLARCLMALQQLDPAQKKMDQAVLAMRNAGKVEYLPLPLLERAECYRQQNKLQAAQVDLDEAMAISQRCQMVLYEADCYLLQGFLALDFIKLSEANPQSLEGKEKKQLELADTAYEKAKALINEMGYGLRQPELSLLAARLFFYKNDQALAQEYLDKAKEQFERMGYWALRREWKKTNLEINEKLIIDN